MKKVIAHVGTYPPENCGIASYLHDLIEHSDEVGGGKGRIVVVNKVLAIQKFADSGKYNADVFHDADINDLEECLRGIERINSDERINAVDVQHEFGIYGGVWGEDIVPILEHLQKRKIVTMHTTIPRGSCHGEKPEGLTQQILDLSDGIIVISEAAKNVLTSDYEVNPNKIRVFHHGAYMFERSPEESKQRLDLEGRTLVGMVGLLRRARGVEYAIGALPYILERHPKVGLLLAGGTHDNELVDGKDVYREDLEKKAKELGVEDHVHWINRFLNRQDYLRCINACDIVLTPYLDRYQVSSGGLTQPLAQLKPVVSFPFLYAEEMLANGRGLLAEMENPESIAEQVNQILENEELRYSIKGRLTEFRNHFLWPVVAKNYVDFLEKDN